MSGAGSGDGSRAAALGNYRQLGLVCAGGILTVGTAALGLHGLLGLTLLGGLATVGFWVLLRKPYWALAAFFVLLATSRTGPFDLDIQYLKVSLVALLLAATLLSRPLPVGPNFRATAFLAVMLALVTFAGYGLSDFQALTTPLLLMQLANISIFYVFVANLPLGALKPIVRVLIGICLLFSLVALLQYLTIRLQLGSSFLAQLIPQPERSYYLLWRNLPGEGVRVSSVFFHSNGFGQFCVMLYGILLAFYLSSGTGISRKLVALGLSAIGLSCLLTLSRGLVLTIAVQSIVVVILCRKQLTKRDLWQGLLLGAAGLFLLLFVFQEAAANLYERIMGAGLAGRELNWSHAFALVSEHWLLGAGVGSASPLILTRMGYGTHYLDDLLMELGGTGRITLFFSHAHNFILNTLVEGGVLTLGIYLLFLGAIFRLAIRQIKNPPDPFAYALGVGILAVLVGCLVNGLIESSLFFSSYEVGFIFSLYAAMLVLYADSPVGVVVGPRWHPLHPRVMKGNCG